MKAEKKTEDMSLEMAFEKLEQTIEALQMEETTLEDSFLAYQEGMKLLKYCNDKMDQVEKKVMTIDKNGELHEF